MEPLQMLEAPDSLNVWGATAVVSRTQASIMYSHYIYMQTKPKTSSKNVLYIVSLSLSKRAVPYAQILYHEIRNLRGRLSTVVSAVKYGFVCVKIGAIPLPTSQRT
jgi:hypothetical protein